VKNGDGMRRAVLGTIALLLIAFISGCISQTQTVTVTETVTETHTEYVPITITPSSTPTSTQTPTESPISTTTSMPAEEKENIIQVDCKAERWRDDYEKAMVCAIDGTRYFVEGGTNDPKEITLVIAKEVGNELQIDFVKENQSMKKGYYFDILTPRELEKTKKGTYADLAMYVAAKLISRGIDTYMVYLKTQNGFGLLPTFKLKPNGKLFVIYWPYIVPIPLGSVKTLLDYGGDPLEYVIIYHITPIDEEYNRSVKVERLEKIDRLQLIDTSFDEFKMNLWKIKEDIPKYIKYEIALYNPSCDADPNLRPNQEFEIYIGAYHWIYSEEYHDKIVEFIVKDLLERLKQQDKDFVIKCDKYYISEITPMHDKMYIHIFVQNRW